jgi:hypothetical protein
LSPLFNRCSGETPTKSNYDWDDKDESVPEGWKTTMIAVNSFGKIVMSKRYLSPDGRFCSSRLDALRYMVKEKMFNAADVERMKAGLYLEGWETDDLLPARWLVKPDRHKEEDATFNYLTPEFQFLRYKQQFGCGTASRYHSWVIVTYYQCCGSGSGSVGSICFWASRILIRIH